MLKIDHAYGSLTATDSHLLRIEGAWKPAREALPGATITDGRGNTSVVKSVQRKVERAILPLTASGRIIAAGETGAPLLSATVNEPQLHLLRENAIVVPPLTALLATYLFPTFFQEVLEPLAVKVVMARTSNSYGSTQWMKMAGKVVGAAPALLKWPLALVVDVALFVVVLGWLAATNVAGALAALAAATLVVLVARRRRAKKAKIA